MKKNTQFTRTLVSLLLTAAALLSVVSCSFLPILPDEPGTAASAAVEHPRRLLADEILQTPDAAVTYPEASAAPTEDFTEPPANPPEESTEDSPDETPIEPPAGLTDEPPTELLTEIPTEPPAEVSAEPTVEASTESEPLTEPPPSAPAESGDVLIRSLIYASIAYDLTSEGFTCFPGSLTFLRESDNRLYDGMLYTDFSRSDLSTPDEPVLQGGFVSVSADETSGVPLWDLITYGAFGLAEDMNYPIEVRYSTYAAFDGSFVAGGKYVVYQWDSPVSVRYRTYDSVREAYRGELGAVYDYDRNVYVVDTFSDDDAVSPLVPLVEDRNFVTLQETLNSLLDNQDAQGMSIEQLTCLYIDPAATAAFAASRESFETFFGFAPETLLQAYGEGTALVITPDGQVTPGELLAVPSASDAERRRYDWEGLFKKIVGGCAIILIGAVLTAATGGTFSCALVSIVTHTLISTAVEAASVFLFDTVKGMVGGAKLGPAMKTAARSTADRLGNIFLANSVVCSFHALKAPYTVCFPADTLVLMADGSGRRIADVRQGDAIRSYDPENGGFVTAVVTDVSARRSTSSVRIRTPFGAVEATANHPFFSAERNAFLRADELLPGYDTLLGADGEIIPILSAEVSDVDERDVFTLEVDGAHTFLVCGSGGAFCVVHNSCGDSAALKRNMIHAGMKTPADYRYAAHHIIPASDTRYRECEVLREYLEKFKVDKNSAVNGVFLTTEKNCFTTAYHGSLHTQEYYQWLLAIVEKAKNRDQFLCALNVARMKLLKLI